MRTRISGFGFAAIWSIRINPLTVRVLPIAKLAVFADWQAGKGLRLSWIHVKV